MNYVPDITIRIKGTLFLVEPFTRTGNQWMKLHNVSYRGENNWQPEYPHSDALSIKQNAEFDGLKVQAAEEL